MAKIKANRNVEAQIPFVLKGKLDHIQKEDATRFMHEVWDSFDKHYEGHELDPEEVESDLGSQSLFTWHIRNGNLLTSIGISHSFPNDTNPVVPKPGEIYWLKADYDSV